MGEGEKFGVPQVPTRKEEQKKGTGEFIPDNEKGEPVPSLMEKWARVEAEDVRGGEYGVVGGNYETSEYDEANGYWVHYSCKVRGKEYTYSKA